MVRQKNLFHTVRFLFGCVHPYVLQTVSICIYLHVLTKLSQSFINYTNENYFNLILQTLFQMGPLSDVSLTKRIFSFCISDVWYKIRKLDMRDKEIRLEHGNPGQTQTLLRGNLRWTTERDTRTRWEGR